MLSSFCKVAEANYKQDDIKALHKESRNEVRGGVMVNDTWLRVLHGDIVEHQADVVVNSTDQRLSTGGMHQPAMHIYHKVYHGDIKLSPE